MRPLPAFAILIACLAFAGCGATPRADWTFQRRTLSAYQNVVGDLNDSGVIDDETFIAMDQSAQAARAALAVAEKYLPAGGDNFNKWLDMAVAIITKLEATDPNIVAAKPKRLPSDAEEPITTNVEP